MSNETSFFGELSLSEWNSGAQYALRSLKKGDVQNALRQANYVVESYLKHRRGTDTRRKIINITTLVIMAIAIILGFASGEWVSTIIVGVIGLAFWGFLWDKIVYKRMTVENEFYDTYEYLIDEIEQLTTDQ